MLFPLEVNCGALCGQYTWWVQGVFAGLLGEELVALLLRLTCPHKEALAEHRGEGLGISGVCHHCWPCPAY